MKTICTQKKYLNYSPEDLLAALDAIKSGTAINTASTKFKIPRATLYTNVIKLYGGKKRGGFPHLCINEDVIAKWAKYMCTIGRPITKDHIINSAELILSKSNGPNPFTNGRPSRRWYDHFLYRNKDLIKLMRMTIPLKRTPISEDHIRKWYLKVTNQLKTKDLINLESTRIFNICETVLLLNGKDKSKYENYRDSKVRVLFAGNAEGKFAPTFIVFKNQETEEIVKLPKNWHSDRSKTGWITAKHFYNYFEQLFYPWLVESKIQLPVIVFLDSCVSYMTQPLSEFCQNHQIEIIILPSNVTRFMQPINVSIVASLKDCWEKYVNIYKDENKILEVRQNDFGFLLAEVLNRINFNKLLVIGFQICGLYPFSVNQILSTKPFIERRRMVEIEELITLQETEQVRQFILQEGTSIEPIILQLTLLKSLERYIDLEKLETFKSSIEANEWLGKIEDTSLFYAWKNILNDGNINALKNIEQDIRQDHNYSAMKSKSSKASLEVVHNEPNVSSLNVHLTRKSSSNTNPSTSQITTQIINHNDLNLDVDFVIINSNDNEKNTEVDML